MMATLKVTVKVAWWVRPYMALAIAVLWTVAPWGDDQQIGAYCERQSNFVAKHGFRFVILCN